MKMDHPLKCLRQEKTVLHSRKTVIFFLRGQTSKLLLNVVNACDSSLFSASVISSGRCQYEDTAPVTHEDQEQGNFNL